MDQCTQLAKNGKRCEKPAGHLRGHVNPWCSHCGENLKPRPECWCNACDNARVLARRRKHPGVNAAYQRQRRQGKTPRGLVCRMRYLLGSARADARRCGWTSPKITAEALLHAWERQQGLCAWTDRPMALMQARLEHNHQTGICFTGCELGGRDSE